MTKPKTEDTANAAKRPGRNLHPKPPPPRAKMRKVSDDDSGNGEPSAPRYGNEPVRFLNKADVVALCKVSYPTIWKWVQQGVFPKGKEVGGKTCWRADEVAHWQNNRPDAQVKKSEG